MKSKLMAAVAALALLAPASALACSWPRIAGTWTVTVVETSAAFLGSGAFVPSNNTTAHATCEFKMTRNRPGVTNLDMECSRSFGARDGARPFIQDGRWLGGRRHWPWHQFHQVSGCEWKIVDLNGHDLTYEIRFDRQAQRFIGQGRDHTGVLRHAVTLTGIKH